MIADIASGEVDTADVFFLIAVVLAIVAAVLSAVTTPAARYVQTLGWSAIASLSLALLVL